MGIGVVHLPPSRTGRGIQTFPQRSQVHSRESILTVRITYVLEDIRKYIPSQILTYMHNQQLTWALSVFIHFGAVNRTCGSYSGEGKGFGSGGECTKTALSLHFANCVRTDQET
jgi:hypothetical protein